MIKSVVLIPFFVVTLMVSGCNIKENLVDETVSHSFDVTPNTSMSSSMPLEDLRIMDVSLSYMSLLSPASGLSTTVEIINCHNDIVAGSVTCEEGSLNDWEKKDNIYFSEDNTALVTYTAPKLKVDDSLTFVFYDKHSKTVLTKKLMVVVSEEGFELLEETV